MDCAFVAPGQHVYTVDVHYQPNEHGHLATEFETSTLLTPAQSIASSIDVQHFSPSASSTASSSQSTHCRCLIDISTPATLERDFYAWLQGNDSVLTRNAPCTFQTSASADFELLESLSPGTSHSSDASSSNQEPAPAKQKQRRKRNVDKGRGTNLYGRPYCPGRPLSMEERFQIIQLFQAGMKVNAISKQLCISHGCVSKIITRFRETGQLMPSSHAECRRRKRQQMEVTDHMG